MAESTPSRRRRAFTWVAVVLLLGLLIVYGIRRASHAAVAVRTAQVMRQDLTSTVSTNGVTEPVEGFEAHAPLSTTVTRTYVQEGQRVDKGKLLLTLDDSSARADLARSLASIQSAQAELSNVQRGGTQDERLQFTNQTATSQAARADAQRNLDTLKKLAASGAASPAEVAAAQQRLDAASGALTLSQGRQTKRYDALDVGRAQSALAEARAQYAASQQIIAQANVRSPIRGTVYSLPVHASDFVQVGEKLAAVADLGHVRVRAYFDEPEIGKLNVGQPATFVWAAHQDRTWTGRVEELPSSITHYGTRNVGQVLLSVDQSDGVLLPSTNVTVTVTTFSSPDVLQIAREALHMDNSGGYVFVLKGGRAVRRPVTIGSVNMVSAQVISGLNEGDTVILGAVNGLPLANNMRVEPAS